MRAFATLAIGSVLAVTSCAAIAGLQDHELAPGADGGAGGGGDDGAPGVGGGDGASGGGDDGPEGDGATTDAVVEVAASATHACAVTRDGALWCWGKAQMGALGVDPSAVGDACGKYACRATPARVAGIAHARHVAVAVDVTCVVDDAGAVSCFGRNARGLVGHDPSTDPQCPTQLPGTADAGAPAKEACTFTPSPVAMPSGVAVARVVGGDSMCALTTGGDVYCWGDDWLAEDGVFPIPAGGDVVTPVKVGGIPGDATAIALSATYAHGCVRRGPFEAIACWGSNIKGELGHPNADAGDDACIFTAPCSPTATVVGGVNAPLVAAGQFATCIAKGDGTVWCWGGNDAALLGNGESVDPASHPQAQQVVGLANVVALEVRFQSGFAIDGDAHVWGWGYSSDGALGLTTSSVTCSPGYCVPLAVRVPALDGATQIASTAAGGVALRSDGTVWAWGLNDVGELGHLPGTHGDATCADGPCATEPARVGGLP
jgi:alpha-tubulin suppressor-like RCC1 family protein